MIQHFDLTGKRAWVGGASKGIGRATAKALAAAGAQVTVLARNEQALQELLAELPGIGHRYIVADYSKPQDLGAKVATHFAQYPDEQPSILVNNTGGPAAGPVLKATTAAFVAAFEQHLLANQVLVQELAPKMLLLGGGSIINIISTSVKQPLSNLGVSNTIRAAVANWAKTLANELGPSNIRVNNVLPGATATERLSAIIENKMKQSGKSREEVEAAMQAQVPLRRFAQAEEIAAAVLFLASPAAAYISGINLPVDGGRTACL